MKEKILLGCVALIFTACRTSSLPATELCESSVERSVEAKVDSVSLHTADSVFVFVHQNDSATHIVERTVRWRERERFVRDTVVVIRTDTIVKTVEVRETERDPPNPMRTLKTILSTATVTAIVIAMTVLLLTLKKKKGVKQ